MRFFTRKPNQQLVLTLDGVIIAVVEVAHADSHTGEARIGIAAQSRLVLQTAEEVDQKTLSATRRLWRDSVRRFRLREFSGE